MKIERRTLETVDLPIGPGRPTVRLTLTRDEEGGPVELGVAVGHGGGDGPDPFRPDRGVAVPGGVLPRLREALDALAAEDGP